MERAKCVHCDPDVRCPQHPLCALFAVLRDRVLTSMLVGYIALWTECPCPYFLWSMLQDLASAKPSCHGLYTPPSLSWGWLNIFQGYYGGLWSPIVWNQACLLSVTHKSLALCVSALTYVYITVFVCKGGVRINRIQECSLFMKVPAQTFYYYLHLNVLILFTKQKSILILFWLCFVFWVLGIKLWFSCMPSSFFASKLHHGPLSCFPYPVRKDPATILGNLKLTMYIRLASNLVASSCLSLLRGWHGLLGSRFFSFWPYPIKPNLTLNALDSQSCLWTHDV